MILLFTFTLALIALTELACRRLPPRNSEALAVLDLKKRSRDLTRNPRGRSLHGDPSRETIINAAGKSHFLQLRQVSGASIAPPVAASTDVILASSFTVIAPSSVDVPVQTSTDIPAPPASDASVQIQTSIDIPAPTSIDALTSSSFPTEIVESLPLPRSSIIQSLQESSPKTSNEQAMTGAGSVSLPLVTPAISHPPTPLSSSLNLETSVDLLPDPRKPAKTDDAIFGDDESNSLPLGPTTTTSTRAESDDSTATSYSLPPQESYAVISNYLPLGPASASESVHASADASHFLPLKPTASYSTADDSDYLPLKTTATYSTPDD